MCHHLIYLTVYLLKKTIRSYPLRPIHIIHGEGVVVPLFHRIFLECRSEIRDADKALGAAGEGLGGGGTDPGGGGRRRGRWGRRPNVLHDPLPHAGVSLRREHAGVRLGRVQRGGRGRGTGALVAGTCGILQQQKTILLSYGYIVLVQNFCEWFGV